MALGGGNVELRGRIPTRVFRIIIFALLSVAVGIWVYWLVRGSGPYHWLQQRLVCLGLRESQVLGALLAFLLVFIVWMIPTFILRYCSDLPLLGEELTATHGRSFLPTVREGLNAQRQTQSEMLDLPRHTAQRSQFFRQMGWVGIGVGLGAWLVTWIAWYFSGQVWPTPLAVGIVGVLGGILSVITGRPIVFDRRKIQNIDRIVKRVGVWVVVLVLLFLAVMCVVEAFRPALPF